MKKLYTAAASYAALGLVSGVFYREFGRLNDYFGATRLSTLHTHLLVLGMFFFLIVMALNAAFRLDADRRFNVFFWTYNVGVLWTTAMMVYRGVNEVIEPGYMLSAALAGVSGLGHIILTVGIVFFFMVLGKQASKVHRASQG